MLRFLSGCSVLLAPSRGRGRLLTLSLIIFTNLPKIRCRYSSPLRVQGAAFRHGFPLAALSCTAHPFFGWSWGSTARGAAALTQGSVDTFVGVGFALPRLRTIFVPAWLLSPEELQLLLWAQPSCLAMLQLCSLTFGMLHAKFQNTAFRPGWLSGRGR